MDHGNSPSITGKQLHANIKILKLEPGTGSSLFETNFDIFGNCCTQTWITWTWEFMWKNRIIIQEDTPSLKLQLENDMFSMLAFAA
eukprot:7879314-Ditylum_brightwellii.AAC.1